MHEATFHIRGGVPYEEVTQDRNISIELWCNKHCDLLHVKGSGTNQVRNEIAEAVGIEHSGGRQPGIEETVESDDEQVIITSQCLRPHTENIETYLAEHDCLLLPPLRYERGGKVVRVITPNPENMTQFYQDIQESFRVEVQSKREMDTFSQDQPMLSVESFVPDLSERQQEAIVMAWQAGYYEIPRETTTEKLARRMGVDRRTFEEHLRLAEHKLIGVLVNRFFNTRRPS
jgi:Predicted DNA binding protein